MSLWVPFGALRTGELREMLEDEDKINRTINCREKFQVLQRAAEKMQVSNKEIAKIGLSQKPKFRDTKLLLAMKYRLLENLKSIIQVKQEQIAEKYTLHDALQSLMQKIKHGEQESEMLFQKFAEENTSLEEFVNSFLRLRKLQHIRMTLVTSLQGIIELGSFYRLNEIHPERQHFSAEEIHNTCLPVCSLTAAVVLPAGCRPTFLLPFGGLANTAHRFHHLPFCPDYNESLRPGARGRGSKWPARPVHLQPLKVHQRRHQQAPR
ncbi:vps37d [Pungitius sinensis]